ncbi:MAG: DoxX family membrane protein [Nanoarchaeota archaeon]
MNLEKYSYPLLSISLAVVFLYFGFSQISSPDDWAELVPDFLTGVILTANNWVIFNGILELTFGIFLLIGLYSRFSALILGIHLLFIAFSIGFNPVGIRDFGLAMATIALFLMNKKYGVDFWVANGKSVK